MRLPLVEPHKKEHTYCAYCPKLCRFACPVSTVEARETTTPWGKMSALHHVAEGNLPLEPELAATWWSCTGCLRCKTFCDHGNEVAAALGAGRAEAMRAGVAPPAAVLAKQDHPARVERAARAAAEIFGDRLDARSETLFVPGCTACVVAPGDARDTLHAVDSLVARRAGVRARRCCGMPLLDAGDVDGFVGAARALLAELDGAREVVFADPGCLYALRVIAPLCGVTSTTRLVHVSELAAEHLDRVPLRTVASNEPVRYHDPCRLGRGLGVYDAPRAVLARLLGRAPDELAFSRERAECSGAGGLLPRTAPESSEAIARERARAHEEAGGGILVTACPGAARALARAVGPDRVADLGAMLGRALGAPKDV